MSDSLDKFRAQIRRRAIVLEIGGFRPPESPVSSWFGRVQLALPDEDWPRTNGRPMHALCQLNVTELPYRPPRLDDIEFITVFIGPNKIPSSDESNGTNWCLRAYRDLNMLVPLPPVSTGTWIEAFPMRPSAVDDDYPIHDDLPVAVPNEILGDYYDHFCNVNGFKLGGWPTLIQSEICWAPWNKHPIRPEYVFQIDSVAKAKWMWGANGVAYFGRGTTEEHLDEWAFAWQCF